MMRRSHSLPLLLLLTLTLFLLGIALAGTSSTRRSRVRRQNMKVRINATGDTIIMKFVRPNPDTKLEGYILGYGSSMFSKQFIQLPENGQPYQTEIDAEPKYLIAVQPIPVNDVKKQCTGKVELNKPLHLVIGSVTPTSVLLSWGTLLKTPYEANVMNDCLEDGHYTVRYRERSRKWNYQTCPTSDTVIDNLKPNTAYEFGVQPNSKDGTGVWSKPVIHNTNIGDKSIQKPFKQRPVKPVKPFMPGSRSFPFPAHHVLHNRTQGRLPLFGNVAPKTTIAPTSTTRQDSWSTPGPTMPQVTKQSIGAGERSRSVLPPFLDVPLAPKLLPLLPLPTTISSTPVSQTHGERHTGNIQTQPQFKPRVQPQTLLETHPKSEPRSVPQPPPQHKPKPQSKTVLKTHPQSQSHAPIKPTTEYETKTQIIPVPQTQAQPKPIAEPEEKTPTKPAPKPQPKPNPELELKTQTKPVPQPQPKLDPEWEPKTHTKSVAKPRPKTQPQPHSQPQLKPKMEREPKTRPKPVFQSHPQTKPKPQLKVQHKPVIQPQPKPEPEPKAQSGPVPQPHSKPKPELQSKTLPKPLPQPQPQPTPKPELEAMVQPKPVIQPQLKFKPKPIKKTQSQSHPQSKPTTESEPKTQTKPMSQLQPQPKPKSGPETKTQAPPVPRPIPQPEPQTRTRSQPAWVGPRQLVPTAPSQPEEGKPLPRPALAAESANGNNQGNVIRITSAAAVPRSTVSSPVTPVTRNTMVSRLRDSPPSTTNGLRPFSLPRGSSNSSLSSITPGASGERRKDLALPKPAVWSKDEQGSPAVLRPSPPVNKRLNLVGKPGDHDKPMDLKQGDKESILKPFPLVTAKPKQERKLTTTSPPALNSSHFDLFDNSSIFSSIPASEVDAMGKKRFVAPHVIYKTDKKPHEPCSITTSLTYFPDEEAGEQNVTGPPRSPPSNLTVVTVEGCPSFVILDWQKTDNETTEYEVISTTQGPNGQEVSILTTNQTHTAVENLKPESSYEFKVKPKNELGSGPSSEPVSFSTESADPRVSENVSGKDAIWTQFPFKSDSYSECNGKQYVKRTWYRKFVGIQLCNSLRYKIYLSDSLNGKFYNIGDQTGHGEDHCQFVDSFLDGRTGTQLLADQLPSRPGFYRAMRQEPVNFGEIGGNSHVTYVGWYECGTPIPGKW
ncbi:target of Nesh-SH3 isoform X2 [Lampris incognitus]|uniref:target of Nesh-SH3 isoform X2 n=1 Tax=Lampris incognitus TaxID=2546036 RepID=UPI0024B4CF2F|nr:target of Nesh-SH3 isoform X2 [Lampris incognitus]